MRFDRRTGAKLLFLGGILLLLSSAAFPFPFVFNIKGLLTGWLTANTDSLSQPFFGLRYIPEFSMEKELSDKYSIDFELSLNAYGTTHVRYLNDAPTEGDIDLYRMWGRFSSSRFEARIGLQKINFGSASLLRPLMWFDRIDPRDPLQLTNGVYGLLLRYYFLNNANIWIWGLYGSDDLKGWEFMPSESNSAEYGGRLQHPIGKGELALSYHHREIDPNTSPFLPDSPGSFPIPENRYAIDGKWDLGIGLWFEGTLTHQNSDWLPMPWQRAINIGMDYTFGLGNGLNVIGEYFKVESSSKAFSSGEGITFSAISLNYPLGLMDNLSFIQYYDWDNNDLYSFLNWRRTYDQWVINVIGFWNPDQFQIYQNRPENNLFSGKGFQIMVIFNY